jgi:predicted RNA-binding Zn-ribbon protein involved in translation (DUF1610 family)
MAEQTENNGHATLEPWERICESCGEPFEIVRGWQRFCCPACKNSWWNEQGRLAREFFREHARREAAE